MNTEVLTLEKIKQLLYIDEITKSTISLDVPFRAQESDSVDELSDSINYIKDTAPSPQDIAEQNDTREFLVKLMREKLKPREYKVLMLRYGFEDNVKMTLEEIGELYGVTRERIRQIEVRAIARLSYIIKDKMKLKKEDI